MKIIISKEENFIELDEIVLSIDTKNELLVLKGFIDNCINEIDSNKYFEHEHFSDYIRRKKIKDDFPEIIIYKK